MGRARRSIVAQVVVVFGVGVLAAVAARGASPAVGPRYSLVLQIVPTDHHAEPCAAGRDVCAYAVRLVVNSSDEPAVPEFPELVLRAGEQRARTVTRGPLSLSCEAGIESDGQRAAAVVELKDGEVVVLSQRVAVWLPTVTPEPG